MKNFITGILVVLLAMSCRKQDSLVNTTHPPGERKIRFQLYTNQDFSGNSSTINFSIFIRKGNLALFDSSLVAMQIKDIPDAAHKLVIEKIISGNDNLDLSAGFHYDIRNIGNASFIDTIRAGSAFKIIDYAFQ